MEQFKGQPRLPKFAVPKRYSIRLKPDLIACKFAGSVAIDLDIVSDTRFIALNAAELSVDAASVSFTHSSKVLPLIIGALIICLNSDNFFIVFSLDDLVLDTHRFLKWFFWEALIP